jgi:hypothetical protein
MELKKAAGKTAWEWVSQSDILPFFEELLFIGFELI